jgi:MFS family permease
VRFPLAWGVLILGNSVLEGFGSAPLIPPVYILTTLLFTDLTSRARAFGRISGMGGIGAATGPLIGGLITTAISWRAAFLFWFFLHIRARERAGKEPLVSTSLFRSRTSNLGLVTQNVQWLLLIGPGLGVMLTPSVNVVQSAFPEDQQGEISGLSRSVSPWARRWAPPSPAPSWCPTWHRGTGPTPWRWPPWP